MIVSAYANCSMGGMATVYRTRASFNPEESHLLVFQKDRGGRAAFRNIPNLDIRIVPRSRLHVYLQFLASTQEVSQLRITADPKLANAVPDAIRGRVVYEFHSSALDALSAEIDQLDFNNVSQLWTPSRYMKTALGHLLPEHAPRVSVVPNLVDTTVFREDGERFPYARAHAIPILWVGRFDAGKNVRDLLRAMSILPARYMIHIVVSLESDPDRLAQTLAELDAYGLSDRTRIHLNLSQAKIAGLYRYTRDSGGIFCSTSLGESFGYSVAEALATRTPVVAYDVGAIGELSTAFDSPYLVPVGDIEGLARTILLLTREGN